MWQRVIRGAGRFKVRNLMGHEFCCILFELVLLLVSYGTATPCCYSNKRCLLHKHPHSNKRLYSNK